MNDYGYATGFISRAEFCPFCGAEIYCRRADGAGECDCGKVFYVIEHEDSEESEE